MESPTMQKPCACCGLTFEPRPQVPDQAFCSSPACQRARKRQWQRAKLKSDPDYRLNQTAAQRAWTERNPDYWQNYRSTHRDCIRTSQERQRIRDISGQPPLKAQNAEKMDVSFLPSGLYRITRHPHAPKESHNSWVVEISLLCLQCPCKMDASREDLIDTPPDGS